MPAAEGTRLKLKLSALGDLLHVISSSSGSVRTVLQLMIMDLEKFGD